ncbi:TolB family protein [Mangrovicoccus algicola]|uniref:TolB family protein n=1 Tax=Mangrovicoccus algicola TaxID=2771008 RepID=A0A8J7CZJ8_9RHOB|nr:PD40 domain-containing protein [Mangrovicoccus algicola]MBE3637993.1 TolB family protein [Mangrovicoccus algicola]
MRSELCLHDLSTGATRVLLATDRLIEAPNWAPGGGYLLVNAEGGLFRVSLDAPDLVPVDLGPHDRLNNDHGISPDGGTHVFCDHSQAGMSVIYTIPAAGGAPRRVTPLGPSWWHGWSPDGARLAYAAIRDERFAIATCALDGSDERILVTGPGHYDGPDYTPDGHWIWFNATRGGTMQLWRMPADGGTPEQMTDAPRDAWFPHPAPGGRHVLYLAYPQGTEGHPRDRDVSLRLIDLETGRDRALFGLFGGQGTINTPCWAPEGGRFAFCRYAPPPA